MKKLIFILLVLLLVGGVVSSKTIEIPKAVAMNTAIIGGGVPVAGGPTYQDYTVDFSEYSASDDHIDGGSGRSWNELSGSGTSVDVANDELDTPASSFSLVFESPTDTTTQYGAFTLNVDAQYSGIYFRSTNNVSETAYVLREDDLNTELQWRDCEGHSCTNVGAPSSCTITNQGSGDSFGFRVTGTGNDTVLEVWEWQDQTPPTVTDGDVDTAWGAADCTLTGNPVQAADTGKYGGIYQGSTNANTVEIFMLGDSQN